jgi:hypothetical protein
MVDGIAPQSIETAIAGGLRTFEGFGPDDMVADLWI